MNSRDHNQVRDSLPRDHSLEPKTAYKTKKSRPRSLVNDRKIPFSSSLPIQPSKPSTLSIPPDAPHTRAVHSTTASHPLEPTFQLLLVANSKRASNTEACWCITLTPALGSQRQEALSSCYAGQPSQQNMFQDGQGLSNGKDLHV